MIPTITIDGYSINDRFAISNIERPYPTFTVTSEKIEGRDGALVKSRQLEPRPVSFRIWAFASDHASLAVSFGWLIELISRSDTHTLVFSDEGGFARTVMLECDPNFDEYVERGSIPLSFMMYDPYKESTTMEQLTIPVGSGNPLSFVVNHDRPHVTVSTDRAQRNSTTRLWGVRFDNGDAMRVEIPTALQTPVSIDVQTRRVLVGNVVSMLTLESDWPVLKKGTHTVYVDVGTGSATLTLRERCL